MASVEQTTNITENIQEKEGRRRKEEGKEINMSKEDI